MRVGDYTLSSVLIALEGTLKIEYSSPQTEAVVANAVRSLEESLGTPINGNLYERLVDSPSQIAKDTTQVVLMNIQEQLKAMSLIAMVSLNRKAYPFHLKQVHYLGWESDLCLAALQILIHEESYEKRANFFPAIVKATSYLRSGDIKRLMTIMAVMEKLGISEGVSIIAQYLYASSAYIV